MPAPTPSVPKKILTASPDSPMRFMRETTVWDAESEGVVRFRQPFEMPRWDGVTENEDDYMIESHKARLDIIAEEKYGNAERMWVLSARNGLDLPDAQLYPGMIIKVPRRDWVERVLLAQNLV